MSYITVCSAPSKKCAANKLKYIIAYKVEANGVTSEDPEYNFLYGCISILTFLSLKSQLVLYYI